MPYWLVPAAMASWMRRVLSGLMTQSRIYAVVIITSTAGTRPLSSERRTRRWLMTALRVAALFQRVCFCSGGGETAHIRLVGFVGAVVGPSERHEGAGCA